MYALQVLRIILCTSFCVIKFGQHVTDVCYLPLTFPIGPKHVVVKFVVKFFPPDHAQLQEELTRLVATCLFFLTKSLVGTGENMEFEMTG